jgi:hypothetical protein
MMNPVMDSSANIAPTCHIVAVKNWSLKYPATTGLISTPILRVNWCWEFGEQADHHRVTT